MTYDFMLIGDKKSTWKNRLKEAISPLGELQSFSEKEALTRAYSSDYHVVIVDESGVKRVEDLVTRFSSQLNPPQIIVVCAAPPRWEDALKLFKAGATDYIRKHWEKDKLAIFFRELLDRSVAV